MEQKQQHKREAWRVYCLKNDMFKVGFERVQKGFLSDGKGKVILQDREKKQQQQKQAVECFVNAKITKAEFLAVGVACKTTYRPTPGSEERALSSGSEFSAEGTLISASVVCLFLFVGVLSPVNR